MMLEGIKYSYNDVAIVPSVQSSIEHRSECDPYKNGMLPIFTAPMSTVVNEVNFKTFKDNKIIPILPRNISFETRKKYLERGEWAAVSLKEFDDLFLNNDWDFKSYPKVNVLIDVANGHMEILHTSILNAKTKYKEEKGFFIMAGNIANPKTYAKLADAGCDAVRLGIGNGFGCLTSSNVSINFPLASLILETYMIKMGLEKSRKKAPLIIADGGIRNYSDVIKTYVLGADYVMIGSVLASLVESASFIYYYEDGERKYINQFEHVINEKCGRFFVDGEKEIFSPKKLFYGMASRKGQQDINGEKKKTSEGVEKELSVTTNISKWSENMASYLRSAMSYTNCHTIFDFNPMFVDTIIISENAQKSINK